MSDTTQTAMARRGAFHLVIGVIGVLMAVYFVLEGFAEPWEGHWAAAFSRLLGQVLAAQRAMTTVVKLPMLNLLAQEVAGLKGAALYPGSWSEWSAQPGAAIAVGPA